MFMLRSTHQKEIERLYRMMALQKAAYDMTRRWYQQAAGAERFVSDIAWKRHLDAKIDSLAQRVSVVEAAAKPKKREGK